MALSFTDKKFYRYLYLRLMRQSDSAEKLGFSVAYGLFIGMFIPPPVQLITMFLISFFPFIKVNKMISAAATFITNPFTMPIIYAVHVYVGSLFIKSSQDITWETFMDWELIKTAGLDAVAMFFVGGGILGLLISVPSYFITIQLVHKHRQNKRRYRPSTTQ